MPVSPREPTSKISRDYPLILNTGRIRDQWHTMTRTGKAPRLKLNQEIHRRIVEAAGNDTLKEVYESLAGRVRRARFAANLSPERWRQAVEEHEAILKALEARDGERLEKIMKAHLRNKADVIKHELLEHAEARPTDGVEAREALTHG